AAARPMIVFILPVLPRPARLPFRSFIGYGNGDTAHQVANSGSALDDPVPSPARIDGWPLGPWANPRTPNSSRRDTAQCRPVAPWREDRSEVSRHSPNVSRPLPVR